MTREEAHHGSASAVVPVFFLSDSTGISAETMGNALLIQFPDLRFDRTVPAARAGPGVRAPRRRRTRRPHVAAAGGRGLGRRHRPTAGEAGRCGSYASVATGVCW